MLLLPNGCKASELAVFPSNWKTKNLKTEIVKKGDKQIVNKMDLVWYIHCRFYAPGQKPKQIILKGMNEYKQLEDRQAYTQEQLNYLKDLLLQGYNPHERETVSSNNEVCSATPLLEALEYAKNKLQSSHHTLENVRSMLKYFSKALVALHLNNKPIGEVKRKDIRLSLDKCADIKEIWTNNQFNTYRSYLSMLFEELEQLEIVEVNPVKGIKKKKHATKKREILTPEECRLIDDFTKGYNLNLWRLIHIFFHSGSRTTEIFRVQGEHVNLEKGTVKYLILKGRNYIWTERPIKDVVLPLWRDAVRFCKPTDFVFSKGLQPGPKQIRPEQIGRRWKRHIKEKLGITCDWYSLKYLNTDQTAALIGIEGAAAQNSHTTPVITMKYAVNEENRQLQKLKKVNNPFVAPQPEPALGQAK